MNKQTSGSGDGISLSMGTLLGNMEGALNKRKKKRYFKRDIKMPCKQVSLHRGTVGEPGGNSFAATFFE